MNFETLNWDILDRLRGTFLEGKPARRAYWTSPEDLAQYDLTFGERIGWKWDAVLAELHRLEWSPPTHVERIIDWGCGSGVAGRRVLGAFPSLRCLTAFDHSRHAVAFARERAAAAFPRVEVSGVHAPPALDGAMVVLSHVVNELAPRAVDALVSGLRRAAVILWVEPGTHEAGRRLQALRERLKGGFDVIAPCPHQQACPLLAPGNERHWCHHFAVPPAHVFTDGHWVRFARRAGIDLRSLPHAYLAMQARMPGAVPLAPRSQARGIGRPRAADERTHGMACLPEGVAEMARPGGRER